MVPPYRFGKGPIAVALEDYLSDRDRAVVLLKELYDRTELKSLDFFKFFTERFPKEGTHIQQVMGAALPRGLVAEERESAEREGGQRLEVFSNGLRMAISLALDIAPNADHSKIDVENCQNPPHPIDISWGCAQPFNQSWVSSRPYGDTRVISLVFYTTQPATNLTRNLLREPLADDELGVTGADRLLLVCQGDPNGDVTWFRPPGQMGIPQPLQSPKP